MNSTTCDDTNKPYFRWTKTKLFVVTLVGICIFFQYEAGHKVRRLLRSEGPIASDRGRNDAVLPFEITAESFHSNCIVRSAPSNQRGLGPRIEPVFQASYPGSGARMTRFLVEAVTELRSGFGPWTHQRNRKKVTIKTHYPNPSEIPWEHNGEVRLKAWEVHSRAILLIRHPLSAIPSYCSFTFEQASGMPHHSTRAPLDYWVRWRENFFDESLEGWATHLQYWMDGFTSENRVVISYESLVHPKTGPNDLYRIHMFLKFGSAIHPPQDIPCIWNKVVNYHKRFDLQGITEADLLNENASFESLLTKVQVEHSEQLQNFQEGEVLQQEERIRSLHPAVNIETRNPPESDSRRRLFEDPSNPMNSFRIGRNSYPFTVKQIEKTVNLLENLKTKYLHEPVLAPILEAYIQIALNAS